MMSISVGRRTIGEGFPPFVIAELSGNHGGSIESARGLVKAAALAGADGLKLQTYTAETMTIDSEVEDFLIRDPGSPWYGRTLYELYMEAQTPWEWHKELFDLAWELGMIPLSSPFDETAVAFLERLDVPIYKVASFEMRDLALIRAIAETGKPMIISTGLATISEIEEAVAVSSQVGNEQTILLKCTSSYPAQPSDMNLRTIPDLAMRFNRLVGISDHTRDDVVAAASVSLGAVVVEKHLTLSRAAGGVDSSFSLEPDEFKRFVSNVKRSWEALGQVRYGATQAEQESLQFRRSLYCVSDVKRGECLTPNNVRAIRPGYGLSPGLASSVFGRRARVDISRGTALQMEHLSEET